jgi:hypothetical protein
VLLCRDLAGVVDVFAVDTVEVVVDDDYTDL